VALPSKDEGLLINSLCEAEHTHV